jgi:hypothetical protein
MGPGHVGEACTVYPKHQTLPNAVFLAKTFWSAIY